jgi:hypothetical protein
MCLKICLPYLQLIIVKCLSDKLRGEKEAPRNGKINPSERKIMAGDYGIFETVTEAVDAAY